MYGMTLCGKYWYLDLLDYLKGSGFKEGDSVKFLFIKQFADCAEIILLNYVDDMIYYGTDAEKVHEEEQLGNRFNMELMGQAHWYLGSSIQQFANFDIELDQSRYCKSIVKRYLDSAGCPKNLCQHDMPLPAGITPTNDDCSNSEEEAENVTTQYNIDFASCVGLLIYLGMMRTDILFAVNKLAKYTRKPGKMHFEVIIHLLRYLRDNTMYGLQYYSDIGESPIYKMLLSQNIQEQHLFFGFTKSSSTYYATFETIPCMAYNITVTIGESPIYKMLLSQNIQEQHLFFGFTESSWNDDQDTGRSTGCFIITYMGGVVDHSSNMPDPVAMSSAEAEYNEGCVAFMAASHLWMLLCKLTNEQDETMQSISTVKAPLQWEQISRILSIHDTLCADIIMYAKSLLLIDLWQNGLATKSKLLILAPNSMMDQNIKS